MEKRDNTWGGSTAAVGPTSRPAECGRDHNAKSRKAPRQPLIVRKLAFMLEQRQLTVLRLL